ncbi:MAG: helix-turn-helix domain-containing protein [Desulfitobacteriaceae bacterium]
MEKNTGIDNKTVGQRIRQERDKLKLSREEFAEMIGLSDYYVGQLERGERQMSLPVLVKVTHCLHLSLDYLVFGKNHDSPYYLNDTLNPYASNITDLTESSAATHAFDSYRETRMDVYELINKCSPKELDLVKKLIITILPYM